MTAVVEGPGALRPPDLTATTTRLLHHAAGPSTSHVGGGFKARGQLKPHMLTIMLVIMSEEAEGSRMLDAELAEIVANLRVLGTDIADVEVKNSHGGLSKSLHETL